MAKKNLYFIFSSFIHIFILPSDLRVAKSRRRLIQTNSFWWRKSKNKRKKLWDVHALKESLSVRPTQCGLLYKQGSPASTNMPIFLFDLWNFGGKNTTNHHEMTVSDCWLHDRWTWDSQIFNKWALRNGSTVKGNKICTVWSILIAWFWRSFSYIEREYNNIFCYCCVPWKCLKINKTIKIICTQVSLE